MKLTITTLAASIVLFAAATASAQVDVYGYAPGYGPHPQFGGPGVVYRHASTAAQGWFDGQAHLTRAMGQKNYYDSLAILNAVEARSRAIDVQAKYEEAYHASRELWKMRMEEARGPRPTTEDLTRINAARSPRRLNSSQYDPALNQVFWPAALQADEFAAERNAIDNVITHRANGNNSAAATRYFKNALDSMERKLVANSDLYDGNTYMGAKNVIKGLRLEAASIGNGNLGVAAR